VHFLVSEQYIAIDVLCRFEALDQVINCSLFINNYSVVQLPLFRCSFK